MDHSDYYSVLHLKPGATQEEIRAAFRRLALLIHPDQSQNPHATEQMQLLNEAYAILGSEEKRAQYDLERAAPAEDFSQVIPETRARRAKRDRSWTRQARWMMKKKLRVIAGLILVLGVLFIWSLLTGEVNWVVIGGFVIMAAYVIVSMVARFRGLLG